MNDLSMADLQSLRTAQVRSHSCHFSLDMIWYNSLDAAIAIEGGVLECTAASSWKSHIGHGKDPRKDHPLPHQLH